MVGNANRRPLQRNPPRPAIETTDAAALQLCKFISAPPPQTGLPAGGSVMLKGFVADALWIRRWGGMQDDGFVCRDHFAAIHGGR